LSWGERETDRAADQLTLRDPSPETVNVLATLSLYWSFFFAPGDKVAAGTKRLAVVKVL